VGRGRGGTASPASFDRGDASSTPHLFGLKFVQKLVHCCNWLLTETQCKIISVEHVCRPKLFKNLCLGLVSGVPRFFLELHSCSVAPSRSERQCAENYNIYNFISPSYQGRLNQWAHWARAQGPRIFLRASNWLWLCGKMNF